MNIKSERHYQHLSYEERIRLDALRLRGDSLRTIARQLDRSPNTISRELRRFHSVPYTPARAHRRAYHKRYLSKRNCLKVATDRVLTDLVNQKLPLKWSPERISGYARQRGITVSKKAIYKYVKSRWMQDHLVFKGKRTCRSINHRRARYSKDRDKRTVAERPQVDGTGHWEIDFITSWASKDVLFVASDRFSKKTLVESLPDRRSATIERALLDLKAHHGIKTLTADNDLASSNWRKLEAMIQAKFYFAGPFASWEKGLVENSNRLIRLFIPKGTNIRSVPADTIDRAMQFLNETPRQILGFKTADEVYYAQIDKMQS